MAQKLVTTLKTTRRLNNFLGSLDYARAAMYTTASKTLPENLREYMPEHLVDEVMALCAQAGVLPEDPSAVANFFDSLKSELQRTGVLKVTLAFTPNRNFVAKLFNRVASVLGREVFLDIGVDKSILGGAVFVLDGKYADKSLVSLIDSVFAEGEAP